MTDEISTSQHAREQFIERNGLQAEASGMPRIAGRLIGIFLLDGGPISFAELAERLQASRASISTNTRLLERVGIIERVSVRGKRQDFFQLHSNPFTLAIEHSIRESLRFNGYVDELLTHGDLPAEATARVQAAKDFHIETVKALEALKTKLAGTGWALPVASSPSSTES
ncbi:GbsR/MarR family transcriptional regulator [Paenalcaligenes sp. Me131]|uniref:GbsR/MarR family transcriptional regulator n=1 Tax=Paenalcaligenes sp. Me131 TaxID=3392636 RepID=UPI003D2AEF6D